MNLRLSSTCRTPLAKFVVPVLLPGAFATAALSCLGLRDYFGVAEFTVGALGLGSVLLWISLHLVHVERDGERGLAFDNLLGRRVRLGWAELEFIRRLSWVRGRVYDVSFRAPTALGLRVLFIPAMSFRSHHVQELLQSIAAHRPANPDEPCAPDAT